MLKLLLVSLLLFCPMSVFAQEADIISKESIKYLIDQRGTLEGQLITTRATVITLQEQIKKLDEEIKKLKEEIEVLRKEK